MKENFDSFFKIGMDDLLISGYKKKVTIHNNTMY